MAGYCDDIEIIINKDNSITIKDDGRGVLLVFMKTGISTVETVYTVLHAGESLVAAVIRYRADYME